jgi:hypothetical protein
MVGNSIGRESKRLAHAAGVVLALLALGGFGTASASASITIATPTPGSFVGDSTPAFTGATDDLVDEVTLEIYAGTAVDEGSIAQTLTTTSPPIGGTWSLEPTAPLPDGVYTAQASQTNLLAEPSRSEPPVTFNVDTAPPAVQLSSVASPTNDSTPSFSGTSGLAEGDVEAVTLRIYPGGVASGSPIGTISATPHNGTWVATAGEALSDGMYTAQAEQSDEAGNTGTSSSSTFTVDTAAPAVSLSPVSSPTSDSTPSLTGGAGVADGDLAEVRLEIYAGATAAGSPVRTIAVSPLGASWSATVGEALGDGTYTARAEQSDEAGNIATSAPSTFTVDATPPAVHVTTPADGSFVNSSKPVLSGTAGSGPGDQATVTVRIYAGSSVSGEQVQEVAVTRSGGSWTTGTSGPQLLEGTYTLQAEQSDEAGNTGTSAPSTFTIKTKGPAVSLTPLASPTNDSTPSFGGSAGIAPGDIDAVTLKIYSGTSPSGSPVRTLDATPSGASWVATPGEPLADGIYTAQAEQSDDAADTATSAPATFIVDTTPPTVHVASPANGAFLKSSKPTLSGTAGSATGDETTVTLKIYAGSSISGSPAQTLGVTRGGGSWTTGTSGPQLLEGTYTLQAEQSDEAGNTGTSAPSTFTIKTTAPTVSLTPIAAHINDSTPSFGGSAGTAAGDIATVTLKIYSGTSPSGSPVRTVHATPSAASWAATLGGALGDGTYTAQAEQSDSAGNTGTSAPSTFTVDTVAPFVSLTPGASERHTSTPQFEGGVGIVAGDIASVTLKVYPGAGVSGSPVRTVPATLSGGKWKAAPSAALANGHYTAQAEQSDEAGNTGRSTPPSEFTINSKGPIVTLAPISAETNDATPAFSGSAGVAAGDIPSVRLKIYSGTVASASNPVRELVITPSAGNWTSGPVEALADGTYTVLAEQSDELGNTGVSREATFTVDTAAPAVTLSAPANGSSTVGGSQLVEGAAGTAPGDSPTITVRLFSGSTAVAGALLQVRVTQAVARRWQVPFEGLAGGTYTVQAEQSDEAGNTAQSEAMTFTLTPPNAVASPPQPPSSSFTWQPSAPRVGQAISLLSSSTDQSSPIHSFAWDLAGVGAFNPGSAAVTTSFATAGNHVVRLRVTAADGLSSVATETIPVGAARAALMDPFPIVRIASTDTKAGIRLRLLRVQAPAGARITVACQGRSCPLKSQRRVATPVRSGAPTYTFRRFERALRAGVVLEVRVWKAGVIGKYTRLAVRRGRLPQRVDECLDPGGVKPAVCPS